MIIRLRRQPAARAGFGAGALCAAREAGVAATSRCLLMAATDGRYVI